MWEAIGAWLAGKYALLGGIYYTLAIIGTVVAVIASIVKWGVLIRPRFCQVFRINLVWKKFTERFGEKHTILSVFYYIIIVAVLSIGTVTLVVSYSNRSIKTDVQSEPFGDILSDATYLFFLQNRWLIGGFCLIAFVLVAIGKYLLLKRRLSSFDLLGNIWLEYADLLSVVRTVTLHPRPTQRDITAVCAQIDDFFVHSATRISVFFEKYTGRKCHVSIKLLDLESGMVRTVARDVVSLIDRRTIGNDMEWYSYSANSAFEEILDKSKGAYLSNWLYVRHLFGKYKNGNSSWKHLYRACLVVAITPNSNYPRQQRELIWGFLTVDNKWGWFDPIISTAILKSFANMYYNIVAISSSLSTEVLTPPSRPQSGDERQ